jgi:large subunit ribosomal protein L30
MSNKLLAAVLVRGLVGVTEGVKKNLQMLNLSRKNQCVVLPKNAVNEGMLRKAKDYITWGEISQENYEELISKRGEEYQGRESDRKGKYKYNFVELNGKKYKKYFRLQPPSKGFGKGIKLPFTVGGALGNRGEKMYELLQRML